MKAFDLHQIRHTLVRQRGKIRAVVAGRTLATIETECGRAAVPLDSGWAARLGLVLDERRKLLNVSAD